MSVVSAPLRALFTNLDRARRAAPLLSIGLAAALLALGCSNDGQPPAPASSPPSSAAASPASAPPSSAPTGSATSSTAAPKTDLQTRAQELAQRLILLDGHIDLPDRLGESLDASGAITEDISQRTPKGDFDFPRARAGGLDAPFMSIYIPSEKENAGAKAYADKLIGIVEGIAAKWPDKFALARTPVEIRENTELGKISLPMGMENGAPIEKKLGNVKYFYDRGIRYITLTHGKDNHIADSSYDKRRTNKGLSAFGKKVVREMNRVGIIIDVSHISDDAFAQVMELSAAPAIASHSSCRHFTPDFERNMSDDMIRALAQKGGVIQIAFVSSFLDGNIHKTRRAAWDRLDGELKKRKLKKGSPEAQAFEKEFEEKEVPKLFATLKQVTDHIDHVVKLVGVDHVGLGSDFDGAGDSFPEGLKDVSGYPNLLRMLLERGYSESDIEKISSGNVLRVWQAVENYAKQAQAAPEKR